MVLQCSSIQGMIRHKMQQDKQKRQQKPAWLRGTGKNTNPRPLLSQKSQFRFQQFKESIRKQLQSNEEYIFNEDFKNNFNNFLVKEQKGSSLSDLIQFQDRTVSKLQKTKKVVNKLNEQMGIELTASQDYGLSKATQEVINNSRSTSNQPSVSPRSPERNMNI